MIRLSRTLVPVMAVILATSPAFAADESQDIQALKKQIESLMHKVETLEKDTKAAKTSAQQSAADASAAKAAAQQASAAPSAPAASDTYVTKGEVPGSFKLPGTNTSFKIGGYIKADTLLDINGTNGNGVQQYGRFASVPLSNTGGPNGQQKLGAYMDARQSRVNFASFTPTSYGQLKTFLEMDFFNSADTSATTKTNLVNGYSPQVRHAYGELGPILAGQTWSNFMDDPSRPEAMDYVGPAGQIFVRQAQIRYTHKFDDNWTVKVSAENPSSDIVAGVAPVPAGVVTAQNEIPDFVGRVDYNYNGGYVSGRVLAKQIDFRDDSTGTKIGRQSKLGEGFAVSGKQATWGKDFASYSFAYGDGIGRYLFDLATSAGNNGSVTYNTTAVKTIPAFAGYANYQHVWSDHFRSNFFGGWTHINNSTQIDGRTNVNRDIGSGHANLIWQPVETYKVGVEYMYGYRHQEDGQHGSLQRIETSFWYNF